MADFFLFIAGVSGCVWLTAFVNGAHLSRIPGATKDTNRMLLLCIVSTVVAAVSLTAYAAITSF